MYSAAIQRKRRPSKTVHPIGLKSGLWLMADLIERVRLSGVSLQQKIVASDKDQ